MSRNKYPGYCYCCGEYVKPGGDSGIMKRHGVKTCIDNMESGVLNV